MSDSAKSWTRHDIDIPLPDGVSLRGWHYAQSLADAPVIVMSHGFGVVKEMQLDLIAEVFAGGGFNCVVYDHRNLGASGGEPRHHIDPWQQVADCREVVTFAPTCPGSMARGSASGARATAAVMRW